MNPDQTEFIIASQKLPVSCRTNKCFLGLNVFDMSAAYLFLLVHADNISDNPAIQVRSMAVLLRTSLFSYITTEHLFYFPFVRRRDLNRHNFFKRTITFHGC